MEALVYELANAMTELKEILPDEALAAFEALAPVVLEFAPEMLESVLDSALTFGLELIESGLDVTRDFISAAGEFIESHPLYEALGESLPALQEIFDAAGRAVMAGLEGVEPGDVARLLGSIAMVLINPAVGIGEGTAIEAVLPVARQVLGQLA